MIKKFAEKKKEKKVARPAKAVASLASKILGSWGEHQPLADRS